MTGFLDRLPAPLRHFVLMVLATALSAGLSWERANEQTILSHLPPWLVPLFGPALVLFVAYVTPFIAQYGNGAPTITETDNGPKPIDVATEPPTDPPAA